MSKLIVLNDDGTQQCAKDTCQVVADCLATTAVLSDNTATTVSCPNSSFSPLLQTVTIQDDGIYAVSAMVRVINSSAEAGSSCTAALALNSTLLRQGVSVTAQTAGDDVTSWIPIYWQGQLTAGDIVTSHALAIASTTYTAESIAAYELSVIRC